MNGLIVPLHARRLTGFRLRQGKQSLRYCVTQARQRIRPAQPGYAIAGTGRAVIDLIFSIAKREVTFFSGTAAISFL